MPITLPAQRRVSSRSQTLSAVVPMMCQCAGNPASPTPRHEQESDPVSRGAHDVPVTMQPNAASRAGFPLTRSSFLFFCFFLGGPALGRGEDEINDPRDWSF